MKTIILLLLTGMTLSPCKISSAVPIMDYAREEPVHVEMTTEERIDYILQQYEMQEPMRKLIIAQAKHESGNFTNTLSKEHNNLFGMLHPKQRPTLSLGSYARAEGRKGYASFTSIENSVQDYIMWMDYNSIPDTFSIAKDYAKILKSKRYYEDKLSNYTKALQYHLN